MRGPLLGNDGQAARVRQWRYVPALYLPSLLMSAAYGASLLALPLVVQGWGMHVANVAYLTTVKEISELVANFPASTVLIRFGARGAMLIGAALYGLIGLPMAVAPNYFWLAALFLVQGVIVKVYMRGEGSLLKGMGAERGSASGVLVASRYFAMAAAPNLTAALAQPLGGAQHMYFVQAGLGAGMVLLLACAPSTAAGGPAKVAEKGPAQLPVAVPAAAPLGPPAAADKAAAAREASYGALLGDAASWREILTASAMCAFVSVLRGAYGLMLPLTGLSLGLPAGTVSMSMSVTYGVAFALAVPGGTALDRLGRRPCAAAAMALFALGHGGLGAAAELREGWEVPAIVLSAFLLGLADSLSSPLGRAVKGDAAAREEGRLEARGLARDLVEVRVAHFFALLDVILDAVGIAYPIALGLVATKLSVQAASFLFAAVAAFAVWWVRVAM